MATFHVHGELDLARSPDFSVELDAFAASTTEDIELDCAQLTFIDSSGIKTVYAFARALAETNRTVVASNVQPTCRRVLQVSGLYDVLVRDDGRE
jgi:anti-anti-sigma factor